MLKIVVIVAIVIGMLLALFLVFLFLASRVSRWSAGMTSQKKARFAGMVKEFFARRGIQIELDDIAGVVRIAGKEGELSLHNLAAKCSSSDHTDEWPEIIHHHFDSLLESQALLQRFNDGGKKDFLEVKKLLKARLYPSDVRKETDTLVFRDDLEGVLTVLVYDFPQVMQTVAPEDLQPWGMSKEELFDTALANVLETEPVKKEDLVLGPDLKCVVLGSDSPYAATHLLLLKNHAECTGPFGALVAAPVRIGILCYPIHDTQVIKAVTAMIPCIDKMFRDNPYSITDNLYWYQEGKFTRIPYSLLKKKIEIFPPDNFVELLNLLASQDPPKT